MASASPIAVLSLLHDPLQTVLGITRLFSDEVFRDYLVRKLRAHLQ
ncbi:MAG: hypothetical protein ACYCYO_12510 [Bacilli bacterium]